MTNDNANIQLLYAIIDQKDLRDIDWNKVAHHSVHTQPITNGHAARMRYSRFKKQMDGTSGVRKPRNPSASPRKPKVEKNKSPRKIKERQPSVDFERIKSEAGEGGAGRHSAEGTPEPGIVGSQHASPMVKREPGLTDAYPLTPIGSQGQTPSPNFGGDLSDMDDMIGSFGMQGHGMAGEQGMYPGVGVMGNDYGVQMSMEMNGPFGGSVWHHTQSHGESNGMVKTERRWEDSYRQNYGGGRLDC